MLNTSFTIADPALNDTGPHVFRQAEYVDTASSPARTTVVRSYLRECPFVALCHPLDIGST